MGCGASSISIAPPNQVEPQKTPPPSALKKSQQSSSDSNRQDSITVISRDYNQNVPGTEPGSDGAANPAAGGPPPSRQQNQRKSTLPNGIAEIRSNADVIHRMPAILKRVAPSSRFAAAVLELKEIRRLANHGQITEEDEGQDQEPKSTSNHQNQSQGGGEKSQDENNKPNNQDSNDGHIIKGPKNQPESMITQVNMESFEERTRRGSNPPQAPPWQNMNGHSKSQQRHSTGALDEVEEIDGEELEDDDDDDDSIIKSVAVQVELLDLIDGIETQGTQTEFQLETGDLDLDRLLMMSEDDDDDGDDQEFNREAESHRLVLLGIRLVNDEVTIDSDTSDCECDHFDYDPNASNHRNHKRHPHLHQLHHSDYHHLYASLDNDVVSSSVEYATVKDDDDDEEVSGSGDGSGSDSGPRRGPTTARPRPVAANLPPHLRQRFQRDSVQSDDMMNHKSVLLQAEIHHHHQSTESCGSDPRSAMSSIETPDHRRKRLGKMGARAVNQRLQPINAMRAGHHLGTLGAGGHPHSGKSLAIVTVDIGVQVKVAMITLGTQTKLSTIISPGCDLPAARSTTHLASSMSHASSTNLQSASIDRLPSSASHPHLVQSQLSTTSNRDHHQSSESMTRSQSRKSTHKSSNDSISASTHNHSSHNRQSTTLRDNTVIAKSSDTCCDQDQDVDEESERDEDNDEERIGSEDGREPSTTTDERRRLRRRRLNRQSVRTRTNTTIETSQDLASKEDMDDDGIDELESNMRDGDAAADLVTHIERELMGGPTPAISRIESVRIQDCLLNKLLDEIESSESLIATMKTAAIHRRLSSIAYATPFAGPGSQPTPIHHHQPVSPISSSPYGVASAFETASFSSYPKGINTTCIKPMIILYHD